MSSPATDLNKQDECQLKEIRHAMQQHGVTRNHDQVLLMLTEGTQETSLHNAVQTGHRQMMEQGFILHTKCKAPNTQVAR